MKRENRQIRLMRRLVGELQREITLCLACQNELTARMMADGPVDAEDDRMMLELGELWGDLVLQEKDAQRMLETMRTDG